MVCTGEAGHEDMMEQTCGDICMRGDSVYKKYVGGWAASGGHEEGGSHDPSSFSSGSTERPNFECAEDAG